MIYVMSDIHGNTARFDSILKQIDLQPTDELYVLGDVIDRYPDGIKILRRIMAMPNAHMLLGNHEYMMLNAIAPDELFGEERWSDASRERDLRLWYLNHGDVTHNYLKHIRKSVRQEIFEYLMALPLNIELEVNGTKYLLIHGGVVDRYEKDRCERYPNERKYAVWYRQQLQDDPVQGCVMVFGHTPTIDYCDNPQLHIWCDKDGTRIGIDCGSGFRAPKPSESEPCFGRLACLRLDDMKEFYSDDGGQVEYENAENSTD